MKTIKTRKADLKDVKTIAGLCSSLGYPSSEPEIRQRLIPLLTVDDHTVLVACLTDGTVVGWIHVFTTLRVESGPFVEIGGFIISEQHQRQGIGKRLLTAAETWAVEQKADRLRVRSRIEREGAKKFYKQMGFHVSKEQRVFDKPLNQKDSR